MQREKKEKKKMEKKVCISSFFSLLPRWVLKIREGVLFEEVVQEKRKKEKETTTKTPLNKRKKNKE